MKRNDEKSSRSPRLRRSSKLLKETSAQTLEVKSSSPEFQSSSGRYSQKKRSNSAGPTNPGSRLSSSLHSLHSPPSSPGKNRRNSRPISTPSSPGKNRRNSPSNLLRKSPPSPRKDHNEPRSPRRSTKNQPVENTLLGQHIIGSHNSAFYERMNILYEKIEAQYIDTEQSSFDSTTLSEFFSDREVMAYIQDRITSIRKFDGDEESAKYQVALMRNLFKTNQLPQLLYLFFKNSEFDHLVQKEGSANYDFDKLKDYISELDDDKLITLLATAFIIELHKITTLSKYDTIFRGNNLATRLTHGYVKLKCDTIRNFWNSKIKQYKNKVEGWPQNYDTCPREMKLTKEQIEYRLNNFENLVKDMGFSIKKAEFGKPFSTLMTLYFHLFNDKVSIFRLFNSQAAFSPNNQEEINLIREQKEKISKLEVVKSAWQKRLENNTNDHYDVAEINRHIKKLENKIGKAHDSIKAANEEMKAREEKYKEEIEPIKKEITSLIALSPLERQKLNQEAKPEEKEKQNELIIEHLRYIFGFLIVPQIIMESHATDPSEESKKVLLDIIKTFKLASDRTTSIDIIKVFALASGRTETEESKLINYLQDSPSISSLRNSILSLRDSLNTLIKEVISPDQKITLCSLEGKRVSWPINPLRECKPSDYLESTSVVKFRFSQHNNNDETQINASSLGKGNRK